MSDDNLASEQEIVETLTNFVTALVDFEKEMNERREKVFQDLEELMTPHSSWTPETTIRQVLTPQQFEIWSNYCVGSEHHAAFMSIADKPCSEITFDDCWPIMNNPDKNSVEDEQVLIKFLMCCEGFNQKPEKVVDM